MLAAKPDASTAGKSDVSTSGRGRAAALLPELGQLASGGSVPQAFEAPRFVITGLQQLAEGVLVTRAEDGDGCDVLTGRSGSGSFDNGTFAMHSYCWCEAESPGHAQGCPPNFVHSASGVTVDWYKSVGRSCYIDQSLSAVQWAEIFNDCWDSLRIGTCTELVVFNTRSEHGLTS